MRNRLFASFKAPLLFTAIFALAFTSGGPFGLLDRLTPQAEAYPGGGNGQCNLHSLKGNWGVHFHGTLFGLGDLVGVGAETCDAYGNCTGHVTFNLEGAVSEDTFTSEDVIQPDCTGTGMVHYTSGIEATVAFVLVDDEIHFVGTDPGALFVGTQMRR